MKHKVTDTHGERWYSSTSLDLGTNWRWVVSFTPVTDFPTPIWWTPRPVWKVRKPNRPSGRPARSESPLYVTKSHCSKAGFSVNSYSTLLWVNASCCVYNDKIGKTRPPFATTFQRVFIITYHSLHVGT
jgi:hypothetical protein